MNKSWLTKKLEELKCAEFFVDRLNKRYSFDYRAKPNESEDYENKFVDVYAYSTSKKHPPLNLQIITREGILYKDFAELRAISKRTGKNAVMGPTRNMATEAWIKNAVKNKEEKYCPSIKRDLVVLISGEFGALFNKEYAERVFSDLKDSEFKGIYSVHLPNLPEVSSHPHDGQILAIKDIYGNHGESF